jgi:hypothetical protein
MFEIIINEAVSNKWDFNSVSEQACFMLLTPEGFDNLSIRHCLAINRYSLLIHLTYSL